MNLPWRRSADPEDGPIHELLVLPEPPNPDFYDPAWDEWDTKRSVSPRTLIVGAVVVVLLVGGFFLYKSMHTPKQPTHVAASTPTTFSVAQAPGSPAPTTFTGKVSAQTPTFTLSGGLTILGASCDCTAAKFQIQVLDSSGNIALTPIQTTGLYGGGTFAGSVPLTLPQGRYTLVVSAIGPWKVTLTTPPADQPTLGLISHLWGGSGPTVIGPFAANHSYSILWSLPVANTPVKLEMVNSLTGAATQLEVSSGSTKLISGSIPAQSTPFYIAQGDTSYYWGLVVKPTS